MASSLLDILYLGLWNSHTLSFDPNGPFPFVFRVLTSSSPSISTLDLSDYTSRTILITGGTSGCGLEYVKALSSVECRIILTARSRERGEKIKDQIQWEAESATTKAIINVVELDQSSFESVRSFPSRLERIVTQLDVVILNAGLYQKALSLCPESEWEETIQVNFLATAALTLLLRPYISRAESGRLLVVSSEAHAWSDLQHDSTETLLQELNRSDCVTYASCQRYHISKLLLILWVNEISRRPEWSDVLVAAASPGYARTRLTPYFNDSLIAMAVERVGRCSGAHGASQYVFAIQDLGHGKGNGGFWSYGKWRSPSAEILSDNGKGIRKTIYKDVLEILKRAGVVDQAD